MPNTQARIKAIEMLREKPHRDIYEAAGPDFKTGCGEFYVTYSGGDSPILDHEDIRLLLAQGYIEKRYPPDDGVYCLPGLRSEAKEAVSCCGGTLPKCKDGCVITKQLYKTSGKKP